MSLSRNFGSHAAIRAGMATADAESIAILAADLQQPVTSMDQFFEALDTGADIVIGERASRDDRWTSRVASNLFWALYRRFVDHKIPRGGVDSFACTRQVRDVLMSLPEASVNLLGLLFWVGYRRATVSYPRGARKSGRSGWTLARRLRYAFDTAFAFSDLPITVMMTSGVVGIGAALSFGVLLLVARLTHAVEVPGYTAIMLAVLFSFSTLLFGLGIIGGYVWRISENAEGRPWLPREFGGRDRAAGQRVGRRRARVRRQVDPGAVTMAAAAFVWHIILMSGAANDNFMHMVMAQQWLAGDWPVHDFLDTGLVLQIIAERAGAVDHRRSSAWRGVDCWPGLGDQHVLRLRSGAAPDRLAARRLSRIAAVDCRGCCVATPIPRGSCTPVAAVLWWAYVPSPERSVDGCLRGLGGGGVSCLAA